MAQNLSNLPIGAKVKFGKHSINGETAQDIIWVVVAKNHTGYPTNSVTLLTERIVDMRCFDAAEPNSPNSDVQEYGLGRYELSNIRQWLNSSSDSWYVAQHTYDQAPNGTYTTKRTEYNTRPGFQRYFSSSERNAILSTPIIYYDYSVGNKTVTDKIFIPSYREITGTDSSPFNVEGTRWVYFTTNSMLAKLSQQAYTNSMSTTTSDPATSNWFWMTRSVLRSERDRVYALHNTAPGSYSTFAPNDGSLGVRPAMNLSTTLSVSDTTDGDGCYTFNWNSAPPVPTTLNVPTIYGGKSATISWSSVNDPDGNAVTYQLEQSVNGGAFTTIYTGANLSYSTVVPYGTTNVQFRARATDSLGASSGYITSTNRTVINNNAPTIDGTNSSLGTKSSEFTQTYKVTDAENNPVTVVESIDGVQIRSYVVTLGATNSFSVTGNTWLSLTNGSHTMTVRATDGVDTTTRTWTFVKSVNSLTITTRNPMATNTRPTRIKVIVNKTIPAEATMKIEACNNGFDSSPTWEDITTSMNNGLIHLFSNTTKTATQWGVRIRVTINRNGGSGACYVSSIGGNWE